ncbi:Glycosyltransferase involved in cell wall bisynthesis [Methanophagales archaeon]|nr:Glycosyltransferase involved in cell wall bisynthesis [Methanophagales archaeon]
MTIYNGYKIGVVVPAYNEEKLIKVTIETIPDFVDRIYIIDDGSTDNTPNIIETLNELRIHFIQHKPNKGLGASIAAGYKKALEEDMGIVAVMAGDNQMDPNQLPNLITPIIEGKADYTKGNRILNKEFRVGMSKWRFFGNAILSFLTKIATGYWHILDSQNGYTAISKKALERIDINDIYPYYGYNADILTKLNIYDINVIDVDIPARYGTEKSKIKYGRYMFKVSLMLLMIFFWRLKEKYIIRDFHPLVLFYIFGIVSLILGLVQGIVIIYYDLVLGIVSTATAILCALLIISGLQALFFAMLFDMEAGKTSRGG